MILILGGAVSGKSQFAEKLVLDLPLPRYYLATMQIWDEECRLRVKKHRAMRAEKQFETLERPTALHTLRLPQKGTVLLEDLGNLTANELYSSDGATLPWQPTAERIMEGIEALHGQTGHLVIVSNELFMDGCRYPAQTDDYLRALALLHNRIAAKAEIVCQVVCGVPHYWKGTSPL